MASNSATDIDTNLYELTSILQNIHSDGLVEPLPEARDYYTIDDSDLPEEMPLSQKDVTQPPRNPTGHFTRRNHSLRPFWFEKKKTQFNISNHSEPVDDNLSLYKTSLEAVSTVNHICV